MTIESFLRRFETFPDIRAVESYVEHVERKGEIPEVGALIYFLRYGTVGSAHAKELETFRPRLRAIATSIGTVKQWPKVWLRLGYEIIQCTASAGDTSDYENLVCAGMQENDVHQPSEFQTMVEVGELLAWWIVRDQVKVAWCALYPRHGTLAPDAWHLYGSWVKEDFRRVGLAEEMWRYRISLVPKDVPVTVSIQPGTLASEKLAAKFGFELLSYEEPWNEFVLKPIAHQVLSASAFNF